MSKNKNNYLLILFPSFLFYFKHKTHNKQNKSEREREIVSATDNINCQHLYKRSPVTSYQNL